MRTYVHTYIQIYIKVYTPVKINVCSSIWVSRLYASAVTCRVLVSERVGKNTWICLLILTQIWGYEERDVDRVFSYSVIGV